MIDGFRLFCLLNPCFILALVLAGGMAACWEPGRPDTELEEGRSAEVVGWVARPPQVLQNRLYVELEPISVRQGEVEIPYPGRLALFVYSSQAEPETFF